MESKERKEEFPISLVCFPSAGQYPVLARSDSDLQTLVRNGVLQVCAFENFLVTITFICELVCV